MTSPADAAPAARPPRHPKQLRIDVLEQYCNVLMRRADGTRPALLTVSLRRDDRGRALLRRPDATAVLAEILDRVERALRPGDRYAVVAVDEIWVAMATAPSEAIVRLAATALRDAIDGFYAGRFDDGTERRVEVGASIGGAWTADPALGLREIALSMERAAGEARATEDRIAIRRAGEDQSIVRAQLATRIREALDGNELEVWFQPQVRLAGRRCESFEALVRWPQRDGEKPISPALLVTVCEESGLIGELTRFNVHTVLRHLMTWNAMGLEPVVGINLSALTLADSSFPSQVEQACATWGVPASQLLFELTEGSIARNEKATIEFMHRLRALGCELSIDDFGTGYSSFSYLREFPVHELKIDRAFVRELATRSADRRIVKVLVEIAHVFGLRALAEGVEDEATVRVLDELGCDAVQGWFFSKAIAGDAVPGWLQRFNGAARQPGAAALTA